MTPAADFSFQEGGRFVIKGYQDKRPFSSFLPGIAGKWGVPLWVFYVNRGQGIASFGLESKQKPILEFQPANKAYQLTPYLGFRTFLKLKREGAEVFYEPFAPWSSGEPRRRMELGLNELVLVEHNQGLGIKTRVEYFILPGETTAGLVRRVTLENTGRNLAAVELLDGLPAVIPFGVDNGALKHVSRTIEAWMQVENHGEGLPFYRLRASASDQAEVQTVTAGHFALGSSGPHRLPVIIDPALVFGQNTSLQTPEHFRETPLPELTSSKQIRSGKTPCAFFGLKTVLQAGEAAVVDEVYGHASGIDVLRQQASRLADPEFLNEKQGKARDLAVRLTDAVGTRTAQPLFDAYVRQTFLDNLLRGGWPVILGKAPHRHVYHLYSRKHGDLERDYNDFYLAAEPFSSGNGNYRDVNQNRRCDVLLKPAVRDHNLRFFLSLIQLDGYNPLVVKGMTFTLTPQAQAALLDLVNDPGTLHPILKRRFTPGELVKAVTDHQPGLSIPPRAFLDQVLAAAEPHLEASYGEGFWIDHWTYLLDQVETYLAVYPEEKLALLLGPEEIPFFQSPVQVRPRRERYVLTDQGPRQYQALVHRGESGWSVTPDGKRVTTSILGKLVFLAGIKCGTLDPEGMGVEMEAGKPGWYDALNGLPGLFGSSLPESYELVRLIRFLKRSLRELKSTYSLVLPAEMTAYLSGLYELTRSTSDPFQWWETANQLRETYRGQVYQGLSGEQGRLSRSDLLDILEAYESKLEEGIARAEALTEGAVPPTYIRHEMTAYRVLKNSRGEVLRDAENRPHLQAREFSAHPLPLFLEGAVRSLKVVSGKEEAGKLHQAVKASSLYDRKLEMFKLNASLEKETQEIGRARAFTPGWLENESIWLHMSYKYLLGLLQTGLYEEFWEEAEHGLVCYQPPARYGRSPLENSSFLVSSAHPDQGLHGAGFVARLSGSTAEFVQMWSLIMAGKEPFFVKENGLHLGLHPVLPARFFDERDQAGFNFLGSIPVTYHNPGREDSWKLSPVEYRLHVQEGSIQKLERREIPPPYAALIRDRGLVKLDVILGP